MKWTLNQKPIVVVLLIVGLTFCFDFINIDKFFYKIACKIVDVFFDVVCFDYYDIPIWQAAGTFGTLAALYFAYRAIIQSNLQLEADQTPYLVMKNHILLANENSRMHAVMFENIGKGIAANITLTADPNGIISIIEGSNPHTVNLGSNQPNNGWAIDENRVIEGLRLQGKKIKSSIIGEIPDENKVVNKADCDFYLYFWYYNQSGKRFVTKTKIRHSGHFLKVMENKVQCL